MLQKDIASIGKAISNQNMFIEPFTHQHYNTLPGKFKHKHILFLFVIVVLWKIYCLHQPGPGVIFRDWAFTN